MFLAPQIPMSAQVVPMSSGMDAPYLTVRHMRQLVNTWKVDPGMIDAATSVVFLVPQHDDLGEVRALFEYVRDNIRYQRDVSGVETLANPSLTLQRQVGDCDDQSTLLATLLEAAGYPTRFVIASYNDPRVFEHVFIQVWVNGEWIDCDPTEPNALGESPPNPLRLDFERT